MAGAETRPDPDVLLLRLKSEDERGTRAKLHVFFGYAPGVGKTYRMLSNARELVVQGWDIVVGAVETHGRYDTASLVLGLELLAPREVLYRGVKLREFDLDAALARRPRVVLLDELAHANGPEGRHAKRWQDVMELLAAGIEVHTTLNVQHLESLNDVVAQITSVRVRETVPDQVLDRADRIELVDVTPDELLERLQEGKVYLRDEALRAKEHFFKRGNLLALRELALRRIAERVDAEVRAIEELLRDDAALANEVMAATQQQSGSTEQMAALTASLAEQARQLESLAGRFKVDATERGDGGHRRLAAGDTQRVSSPAIM